MPPSSTTNKATVGSAGSRGTARRISPSCSQATTHGASSVTSTPPPASATGSTAPGCIGVRRAPTPTMHPGRASRNLSPTMAAGTTLRLNVGADGGGADAGAWQVPRLERYRSHMRPLTDHQDQQRRKQNESDHNQDRKDRPAQLRVVARLIRRPGIVVTRRSHHSVLSRRSRGCGRPAHIGRNGAPLSGGAEQRQTRPSARRPLRRRRGRWQVAYQHHWNLSSTLAWQADLRLESGRGVAAPGGQWCRARRSPSLVVRRRRRRFVVAGRAAWFSFALRR